MSKDFLRPQFAVDQVLSISDYDLENKRIAMEAKILNSKYPGKNFDFDFVPLLFTWLTFCCLCCSYNHFHNILRVFDVLSTFLFTASERMRDHYL